MDQLILRYLTVSAHSRKIYTTGSLFIRMPIVVIKNSEIILMILGISNRYIHCRSGRDSKKQEDNDKKIQKDVIPKQSSFCAERDKFLSHARHWIRN